MNPVVPKARSCLDLAMCGLSQISPGPSTFSILDRCLAKCFLYSPIGYRSPYWNTAGDITNYIAMNTLYDHDWINHGLSGRSLHVSYDRFILNPGAATTIRRPISSGPPRRDRSDRIRGHADRWNRRDRLVLGRRFPIAVGRENRLLDLEKLLRSTDGNFRIPPAANRSVNSCSSSRQRNSPLDQRPSDQILLQPLDDALDPVDAAIRAAETG